MDRIEEGDLVRITSLCVTEDAYGIEEPMEDAYNNNSRHVAEMVDIDTQEYAEVRIGPDLWRFAIEDLVKANG